MNIPSANWTEPGTLVLSCARGLAPFAAREAKALGFEVTEISDTAATVRGSLCDAMRLNLWLRTAHRVLWLVSSAEARNLTDLYGIVRELPWERWIEPDGYFTVNSTVRQDTIRDTRLPALRIKDAVVDRLRAAYGRRPDSGSEYKGVALFALWRDDEVRIYVDTTGEPLSKRGYRLQPGKAPMQETLAAACILAADWHGTVPFVAPMCGSGTPAIEAAMIACRQAPGILRERFCFMSVRGFTDGTDDAMSVRWEQLRNAAREHVRTTGLPPIIATDLAPEAVDAARQNARRAGVEQLITFGVCDFAETEVPATPGVVFMNPEYGERMGDASELVAIYGRIGDFLKRRCNGYRGFVLTGNLELSRRIGLHSSRRLPLYNGPIECRLVAYDLYVGTRRADPPAVGG